MSFRRPRAATPPPHTRASSDFEVAKPLLERAFEDTYGMRLEKVFMNVDLAIGSYRRAVGTVLPAMTRVAWQLKKQEIRKDAPSVTRKAFLYNLSRSSYEKELGLYLSAARDPVENPGISIPHYAEGRPVPAVGLQEADPRNREDVHGQLQFDDRPLS